jgi:2-keto-3-deoxy-L-rhamnonate aldolase RhmA
VQPGGELAQRVDGGTLFAEEVTLAKQRSGKVTVGLHVGYVSSDLAEQAAHVRCDGVWLDAQHGSGLEVPFNNPWPRFLAVESIRIARVRAQDSGLINRAVDVGAHGGEGADTADCPAGSRVREAHYESLVEPVVAASKKTASAAGHLCAGRERAETRIAQGFRFISLGTVTEIVAERMQDLFADCRGW